MDDIQTPGDRLRALREKRFATASEAAEALGQANSTYTQHENGNRDISRQAAVRYADFFYTSVDYILTGKLRRTKDKAKTLPLLGQVGAGAVVNLSPEEVPGAALDEIAVYFEGDFILEVIGDSMWPRYMPGERIVVEGQPVSPSELLGRYAVVQLEEDGRYLIKKLLRGDRMLTFNLWSHNADEMKNMRLLAAWKIRGVLYD